MLLTVNLENVRTHTKESVSLGVLTHIKGVNGAGKTTVADAIAYLFTGRDSHGAPAPIHLISDGADKLLVEVETEKAVISRTLSRKKNSTIKFTSKVANVPVTMSQTDLSERCGVSPDTFLSAAFAGYFFTLDTDKRMEVLRSFVPPVDKAAVLRSLLPNDLGLRLEGLEPFLRAEKRSDLEAAKVADARRNIEREMDIQRGRCMELNAVINTRTERPYIDEAAFRSVEARHKAWEDYRRELEAYERVERANAVLEDQIKEWERRFQSLIETQSMIPADIPDNQDEVFRLGQEVADIKGQLKQMPQPPSFLALPSSDRCMTCGQVIGVKHREKMGEEKQKTVEAYQKECDGVRAENEEVLKRLHEAENAYEAAKKTRSEILKSNGENAQRRKQVQGTINEFMRKKPTPQALSEKPEAPLFPEISAEEFKNELDAFSKSSWAYKQWEDNEVRVKQAEAKMNNAAGALTDLTTTHQALSYVEAAYKRLDQKVFELSKEHYVLRNGFTIVANEKSVTVVSLAGRPYEWMSAGERIRASAYLCEKMVQALHPRIPFVFVDNVDLVTGGEVNIEVPQVMYAHVTDGPFSVEFDR